MHYTSPLFPYYILAWPDGPFTSSHHIPLLTSYFPPFAHSLFMDLFLLPSQLHLVRFGVAVFSQCTALESPRSNEASHSLPRTRFREQRSELLQDCSINLTLGYYYSAQKSLRPLHFYWKKGHSPEVSPAIANGRIMVVRVRSPRCRRRDILYMQRHQARKQCGTSISACIDTVHAQPIEPSEFLAVPACRLSSMARNHICIESRG